MIHDPETITPSMYINYLLKSKAMAFHSLEDLKHGNFKDHKLHLKKQQRYLAMAREQITTVNIKASHMPVEGLQGFVPDDTARNRYGQVESWLGNK